MTLLEEAPPREDDDTYRDEGEDFKAWEEELSNDGGGEEDESGEEGGKEGKQAIEKKRISFVEAMFMVLLVTLPLDTVEVLVNLLIPGISIILIPWDLAVLGIVQFYLHIKGGRWEHALVGNVAEMLPIIDFLPIRTVTFMISVYKTNHPKGGLISRIAEKTKMGKGIKEGGA